MGTLAWTCCTRCMFGAIPSRGFFVHSLNTDPNWVSGLSVMLPFSAPNHFGVTPPHGKLFYSVSSARLRVRTGCDPPPPPHPNLLLEIRANVASSW